MRLHQGTYKGVVAGVAGLVDFSMNSMTVFAHDIAFVVGYMVVMTILTRLFPGSVPIAI